MIIHNPKYKVWGLLLSLNSKSSQQICNSNQLIKKNKINLLE